MLVQGRRAGNRRSNSANIVNEGTIDMFFLIGINEDQKELTYNGSMTICGACGRYGRFIVFMTFTVLSLFFIPCFKWNRKYYVRMSCCNTVYELDPEIGKQIAKGEDVKILPEHLTLVGGGRQQGHPTKICMNCGFTTKEDFDFCPKCGRKF